MSCDDAMMSLDLVQYPAATKSGHLQMYHCGFHQQFLETLLDMCQLKIKQ